MEFITTKLHKETKELIRRVQAQEQLEKGERFSEADIIDMLTKHYVEEKYGALKKPKYKFSDLIGNDKSPKKSHPDEIDKIVYEL